MALNEFIDVFIKKLQTASKLDITQNYYKSDNNHILLCNSTCSVLIYIIVEHLNSRDYQSIL